MRRQAKATSSASSAHQGSHLVAIVRGGLAARGLSPRCDGSRASSGAHAPRLLLAALATLALTLVLGVALAAAVAPAVTIVEPATSI